MVFISLKVSRLCCESWGHSVVVMVVKLEVE